MAERENFVQMSGIDETWAMEVSVPTSYQGLGLGIKAKSKPRAMAIRDINYG